MLSSSSALSPQNSDRLLLKSGGGAALGQSAGFKDAPYTHLARVLVFCDYFQLGWIGMEICDEEKEVNGGGGARQMDC